MENKKALFEITDLQKFFPLKKAGLLARKQSFIKANDGITLTIYEGESFGLVGESGCGKSTFGRVLLKLYPKTGGSIRYYGRSLRELCPRYLKSGIRQLAKIARAQKKAAPDEALLRMFGGLAVVQDLHAAAAALLDEYHAGAAQYALRRKKARLCTKSTAPLRAKAAALEQKLARQAAVLADCAARVDGLRARYQNDAAFVRAEALRDDSIDLSRLSRGEMRRLRVDMQMIFQDSFSSLNPRMTAGRIIGESVIAHGLHPQNSDALRAFVQRVMEQCGLAPYLLHRYPHQLSGGQRQRVSIARALAPQPKFIVCDEAVSALDVSVRAQILNLLQDLKAQNGLTYLFISHDLSVVKYISDRIGVMYLGRLVELSETSALFRAPLHPYTKTLLSSVSSIGADSGGDVLPEGDVPSPAAPPDGCGFHTRCRYKTALCQSEPPCLRPAAPGHMVACHHYDRLIGKEKAGD